MGGMRSRCRRAAGYGGKAARATFSTLWKGGTSGEPGHRMGNVATLAAGPAPCMMAGMTDWNFVTVIVVLALFALWNLELAATLLNLKAFPARVPAELADLMDDAKLDRAREYLLMNARLGVVENTTSLVVLLVFWFAGGFGWLDAVARSVAHDEVKAGLVFLSAIFLGQALVSLPFSIYDTFVIEERFGFNRATLATFIMDRLKGLAARRRHRPAAGGRRAVDLRKRRRTRGYGRGWW